MAFSEPQILYSGAIGEGSRILYNRTPKERVEAVAPWLTIDGDAYPAVVDGRIQWIVDAYTTTNGYPYSSRTTLGDTTADSLTDQPARGGRPAEPGQLHPQLGEGDRRRVRRHGQPVPVGHQGPGAEDLDEGVPGHGQAEERDLPRR